MKEKHRFQVDLSPELMAKISAIRDESGATTNAEVLRRSFHLYSWLVAQKKLGYTFQIEKEGEVKDIEFLF